LIPVGVLMVIFMRILVGLRTSGTFMPVLIALAFMETSLLTGIIGFAAVVGFGLLIRSYLSRHNLLLVARIGTVILSVIIIIAGFSIIANSLGFTEGLKITFFPMIILSWTIERMSILWEEEGPKEVLAQGGGSLFVAILAYAVMINPVVRYWMFNFIGLQFVFMAIVLMCGNYTGYRLTELKRFGSLFRQAN
jgi:7 transmembrane helices usually fused to an inactive transglutaminase